MHEATTEGALFIGAHLTNLISQSGKKFFLFHDLVFLIVNNYG